MYHPTLGRWIQEDPIGFEGGDNNLYGFVSENPVNGVDPSGLLRLPPDPPFPINPAERELEADRIRREMEADAKRFSDWVDAEKKNMDWLKELPNPPDALEFGKVRRSVVPREPGDRYGTLNTEEVVVPVLPDGWEWDSKFAMNTLGYHPNAAYGIRSKKPTPSGAGQQAMYDKNGKLITGGLSAGTPDKVSPHKSVLGHRDADVKPFDLAKKLDKYYGGDKYRKQYLEVRPPCKSPTAPPNVVN
jgi:hypothetical protein